MSFQLMRYTELTPAETPAELLSVADVLAELSVLRDALPQARQGLAAATGNAARVAAEWEENLAQQRAHWGAAVPQDVPTPARVGEARELAEQAADRLAGWTARRSALLVALREKLPAEEAAIARERESVAADERALEGREERLRQLTEALVQFEGYATIGGLLSDGRPPLIGKTDSLRGRPVAVRLRYTDGRAAERAFITLDGAEVPLIEHAERAWAAALPALRPLREPTVAQRYLARRYPGQPPRQGE